MCFHLSQAHDGPHGLGIVARRLCFGIDVLDVVGDAFFLFFQPLDTFDEPTQLVGRDIAFTHYDLQLVWRTRHGPMTQWKRRLVAGSEEHTSELQSLMRISYAVFCLTKNNK